MSVEFTGLVARTIRVANSWYVKNLQRERVATSIATRQLISWLGAVRRRKAGGSVALPYDVSNIISEFMGSCFITDTEAPLDASSARSQAIIMREQMQELIDLERDTCQTTVLRIYTEIVTPQIMNHIDKGKLEGTVSVSEFSQMPLRQFSKEAKDHQSNFELIVQRIEKQGFLVTSTDPSRCKIRLQWH